MQTWRADEIIAAYRESGTINGAARLLGACPKTIRRHVRAAEVGDLPSEHLPIEEIIEHRKKAYAQKHKAKTARKLVNVRVADKLPIGILHFGDPHVDDDGTDLDALFHHCALVKSTEGLYGANIGDITNNWVGGLKRLYAEQSTSETDAWRIAEHFLKQVDWLYLIRGNHDCWSGAGDPLKWILRDNNGHVESHGCRLNLQFSNGMEIRINAAHNFKGHSQWNTTHGVSKAAQMGLSDHILVNGHTHVSGYTPIKSRDPMSGINGGRISHCLQIASYKVHDKYAEQLGLPDQSFGPAALTIIDQYAETETGLVQVFFDIEAGLRYLKALRSDRDE